MSVPFDITVQAQLDGTWTDITDDTLYHHRVRIRRGASSESQTAPPVQCALALRDDAGNSQSVAGTYDPYNPASPYFGKWGENTPLRVYLGTEHLGAGGGSASASTSHVAPSVTATEDGLLVCMWLSDGPIDYTVPVSMTGLTERDGALNTSVAAYEAVSAGATGTRTATASASREYASASVVLHGSSLTVESAQSSVATNANVTLTTPSDTEAGWWLVALHGYAWASGPTGDMPDAPYGDHGGWIELADSGWISGSPNDLRVRAWVRRVSYAGAQDVIFSGNDDAGLLYNHAALLVVSGDITDWDIRISPEVSSIQHDWTVESDVRADVVASGILRRLQQGSTPLRSAPARYIPGTDPVAYWPLEDGPLSAVGTAEVGQPMRPFIGTHTSGAIVSYPRWGSGSLGPWLPSGVSWSNSDTYSIIWAPVDMSSAFTSQWSIDLIWASGSDAGADDVDTYAALIDVNPAYLGGSVGWPQLAFSPSTGNVYVSLNGETRVAVSVPELYDGLGHHVRWQVAQSGSNGQWSLWVDGTIATIATTSGAMTVTPIEQLALVGTPDSRDAAMGYVAVYGQTAPSHTAAARAALGFVGETAGRRFERLCREEGIAVHIVGDPDETESMGPQPLATLVSLLRSCEATDMGIMYEPREVLGLAYRTRRSLYNQPATLSADYGDLVAPLNPAADDRFVRNDVTVNRRDGSSARSVQETGSKNVQDPPNGVGRYDTTVTVDAQSDLRLPDLASWQRHLGTVDERRFPAISAKLQGLSTATARSFRGVDVGDRLEVTTNLPARLRATGVDQLVLGYTETLTSHTWDWATNTAPVAPYRILEIGLDGHDILGSDSATIAEDLDATETEVDVNCGAGPDIIHEVDYDIVIGGEQMTITAVSAMSGTFPNRTCTLTVVRSVNGVVKSHSSGTAIQMAPRVFVG